LWTKSQRQNVLGNLVKHQDRAVPILLVDDFEAVRITKHGFDAGEGAQNFRDASSGWRVESVLHGQLPPDQGLLHMFGSEEGVKGINRVLENVKGQTGDFQRIEIILPKGSDEEDGGVGVWELKKTLGRTHEGKSLLTLSTKPSVVHIPLTIVEAPGREVSSCINVKPSAS